MEPANRHKSASFEFWRHGWRYFFVYIGFNKAVKDKISENLEIQQIQTEFTPTILSEQEISQLDYESVYFIDQRKINTGLPIRYFINIAPEILLKNCGECAKFFLLDEYEF